MKVEASEIPVNQIKDKIVKHSVEMGIDPALALSIAKAESGYVHASKSPYGAVGVFQLMPSTAKKMGVNPYHLDGNIRGGLMYYKMLYKMFGSQELALAAYHTGPAYVIRHKRPAPCSKRYISAIMKDYYWLKAHTDPAVIRHKTKAEQIKRQKAKAELEAKAAAEAREKAKAAEARAKAEAESRIEAKLIKDIINEQNSNIEENTEVKDCISAAI